MPLVQPVAEDVQPDAPPHADGVQSDAPPHAEDVPPVAGGLQPDAQDVEPDAQGVEPDVQGQPEETYCPPHISEEAWRRVVIQHNTDPLQDCDSRIVYVRVDDSGQPKNAQILYLGNKDYRGQKEMLQWIADLAKNQVFVEYVVRREGQFPNFSAKWVNGIRLNREYRKSPVNKAFCRMLGISESQDLSSFMMINWPKFTDGSMPDLVPRGGDSSMCQNEMDGSACNALYKVSINKNI
jgi:hypothetical protein